MEPILNILDEDISLKDKCEKIASYKIGSGVIFFQDNDMYISKDMTRYEHDFKDYIEPFINKLDEKTAKELLMKACKLIQTDMNTFSILRQLINNL